MMSSPRLEQVAKLLNLPDSAVPVAIMAVGYPAESWEAGGQTVKPPFDSLFSEMEYGKPFEQDPAVNEELKAVGMIHPEAPLPWRDAELKYLETALGLERKILAINFGQGTTQQGGSQ